MLQLLPTPPLTPSAAVLNLEPRLLGQLGVAPRPGPGEAPEEHARRLETALMVLFRETGSEAAFTALYELTRASLAAWILHLSRGRGPRRDPLELVQDTYVNIYRYAQSFRSDRGGGFRGWARTIAANAVRRAQLRAARGAYSELPEGHAEPQDPRQGPAASCSLAEQGQELRRAWALLLLHYAAAWETLSPRDQEALTLVEVEGKSYAEAGALLRVGRSNMKMIMFRARKRLRAHVRAAMGEALEPSSLRAVS